ncbi:MAG: hypothetical protein WD844_15295 [Thermoleophilaceae bacterium]
MRAATTFAALTAAAALLFAVTGAGADSEDPAAVGAQETGPRHQLLGSWKAGRRGKLVMRESRGRVSGRVSRTLRIGGCRVPRRVALFRSLRFVRRELQSDVWVGRLALPDADRDCRRRTVSVRVRVSSDLRVRALYRDEGRRRTLRMRRVRPRVHAGDPVLGTWERRGAGITVRRRDDAYVGVARDAFLLSNNCTVSAGTVVWRLRPSAPERYDGAVQTFLPPPTCDPGTPSDSRWRLESEDELVREAPDGSITEYTRAAE